MRTLLTIVLTIVVLVWSPAAHADPDTFMVEVEKLGMTDRTEALRNGYTVCVMRTEADADLTDRAIRGALDWLNRDQSATNTDEFVQIAVSNLCPEFKEQP